MLSEILSYTKHKNNCQFIEQQQYYQSLLQSFYPESDKSLCWKKNDLINQSKNYYSESTEASVTVYSHSYSSNWLSFQFRNIINRFRCFR